MTRKNIEITGISRDWPTLVLLLICYAGWVICTGWLADVSLALAIPATGLFVALHASLQHEVIHGHPFRAQWLNAALVFPSLNLAIPYLRFRDTHMEHHKDSILTDPYDDPETNYVDPVIWERLPMLACLALRANNTLLGRLLIGPLIGQVTFMQRETQLIADGDRPALVGWLAHIPATALVLIWVVWVAQIPLWAYLIAAYIGLSILKLRTYLEHQAHGSARGRTVVIEDRGLFALLFLNNNYHVVHHMHPGVPWFQLPALFRANRDKYLRRNHGYYYASYLSILRRYLLRTKDPVAHPLWRGDQRISPLSERAARRINGLR